MKFARILLVLALLPAFNAAAADPRPFVRGSWSELLKAKANKPIVAHFWGLTCAPCLTELPHWAKLQKERPDLAIVMIASDPAPGNAADLAATLKKAGLGNVESWAFADGFHERLRFEIDPKWRGEMPRTILIGHDGRAAILPGLADLPLIRRWHDAEKVAMKK